MRARKEKSLDKLEYTVNKEKRDRLKRIGGSIIVGLVVWGALLLAANSIINESKHVEVCIAKTDIPNGTKITIQNAPEFIETVSIAENQLPNGYIDSIDKLDNVFVGRDYLAREIITSSTLSSEESMTKHIVNPIEVSVAVSSIDAAVGGILREGDYINIYSVNSSAVNSEVNLITKNAYITKALDSNGMEVKRGDTQLKATVINLIIPMDIEERFNKELLAGTVRMSLIYNPDIENMETGIDNTDIKETNTEELSTEEINSTEITDTKVDITRENNEDTVIDSTEIPSEITENTEDTPSELNSNIETVINEPIE